MTPSTLKPRLLVNGVWLDTQVTYGDVEWTNCWPGGTESITFDILRPHRLIREDAIVQVVAGTRRVGAARIREYARGDQVRAEGLFRAGEDEPGLTFSSQEATLNPGYAVDNSIAAGIPWLWPTPTYRYGDTGVLNPSSGSTVALDADQLYSVSQILDAAAEERAEKWGINAEQRLVMAGWAAANLHILEVGDGLAISRDGYASRLTARYVEAGTGIYRTISRTDAAAEKRWGRVPRTLTELLGEGEPMDVFRAAAILDAMLVAGQSQIGWSKPIEVQYGDVLNNRQQPVDLALLHNNLGGLTAKLHGLTRDTGDLRGQSSIDMRIQRIQHRADRSAILEPVALAQPMNDALAGAA